MFTGEQTMEIQQLATIRLNPTRYNQIPQDEITRMVLHLRRAISGF